MTFTRPPIGWDEDKHGLNISIPEPGTRGSEVVETINEAVLDNTWRKLPKDIRDAIKLGAQLGWESGSTMPDGSPNPVQIQDLEPLLNLSPQVLKYKAIRTGISRGLGFDPRLVDQAALSIGGARLLTKGINTAIPKVDLAAQRVGLKPRIYKGANPRGSIPMEPLSKRYESIINDAFKRDKNLLGEYTYGSVVKPGSLFSKDYKGILSKPQPYAYAASSGGQGELFPGGPIDPAGKEAYRIFTESLAKRSGYDTFKMMKRDIFDKWPQKDKDQAFRQLWQGTQTGYVGYSEHLTAKASKKLRRDKLVKKYPNETLAQIDVRLAKKSQSTFDMDWLWDREWIDEKGIRRTDGLNRGDRNAPENMQLLFNDRLKSMKDVLENVGYGSEESPGILWGTPAIRDKDGNITKAGSFRSPENRFLIKFETPEKRSVKKGYLRQNPGDAVIYRASNGKIIGNIGQYLDVLYPKKYKHPQTGQIINLELELMEKGVSDEINPKTGKLFTGVEEFREFILTERLEIILRDTNTLPSNATARKRYIKDRIDQDMVDLRDRYPWLPKPPSVIKDVESSLTTEDFDLRTRRTTTGEITKPKEKSKPINYKQLLLDILGKDE